MSLVKMDYSLYNNTLTGLVGWKFVDRVKDKWILLTPFMGQDFTQDSEAQMLYAPIEDEV